MNKKIVVAKWMIWLIATTMFVNGAGVTTVIVIETIGIPEDPPKKEIKKDTTKINIQQMQEKNLRAEQQIRLLDSLIMKIDSTKINKK